MSGSENPRWENPRWVPVEDWLTERQAQRLKARARSFMTPASPQEILALRRKKSGPGVSHHTNTPPRHRRSA